MSGTSSGTLPGSPGPALPLTLESVPAPDGEHTTVRVAGELDMATAPLLVAEIVALVERRHQHVVVDLAGVTFCDAAGLAAVLDGRRRLAGHGGSVLVHDPCSSLRTVLEVLGVTLDLEAPPARTQD